MKVVQAKKNRNKGWEYLSENSLLKNPLVLVFGGRFELEDPEIIQDIRKEFPYENLVFGSTSGEIIGEHVFDTSIVVTAIEFEKSSFIVKTANIFDFDKNANTDIFLLSLTKDAKPTQLHSLLPRAWPGSHQYRSSSPPATRQSVRQRLLLGQHSQSSCLGSPLKTAHQ